MNGCPKIEEQGPSLKIDAFLRRNIITKKVKLLMTLYRPLPPPSFLLSKAKASCSSLPSPQKKVSKNCTLSRALVLMARLRNVIKDMDRWAVASLSVPSCNVVRRSICSPLQIPYNPKKNIRYNRILFSELNIADIVVRNGRNTFYQNRSNNLSNTLYQIYFIN